MKEYITAIIEPYRLSVIQDDPSLADDQKLVLYLDIYPVHAGVEFWTFVFDEHPHIILIFVPGNCTGIFQPADVGLQRIIKHRLKQELFTYLFEQQRKQIRDGIDPDKVKIATGLPELRDASVKGLVKVFNFMQTYEGKEIVRKASSLNHSFVESLR
jgi:hypothetical protein